MQGKGAASMIRVSFQLPDYTDVVPFLLATTLEEQVPGTSRRRTGRRRWSSTVD